MQETLISDRFCFLEDARSELRDAAAREAFQNFSRKKREGAYQFEEQPCFCGSQESLIIAQRDHHGLFCQNVICRHCGLIRINPRLTEESYAEFYQQEYRALYGGFSPTDQEWESLLKQGRDAFQFFSQFISQPTGVVFEIGCFMGAYLVPFQERGWDVAGVDFGEEGIAFGKEKSGIQNLFCGGIERLEVLNKKADIIICNHVVEHFTDLKKELLRIRGLLKPGGIFLICVPGTFWWPIYAYGGDFLNMLQTAHCWQFSLNSLTYVMQGTGFQRIYGDEMIRAVFKKDDEFCESLAVDHDECTRVLGFLNRLENMRLFYKVRSWGYASAKKFLEKIKLKRAVKKMLCMK